MRVGVPREVKAERIPGGPGAAGVKALVAEGHEVWLEQGAGLGAGIEDCLYQAAGAKLVSREQAWW